MSEPIDGMPPRTRELLSVFVVVGLLLSALPAGAATPAEPVPAESGDASPRPLAQSDDEVLTPVTVTHEVSTVAGQPGVLDVTVSIEAPRLLTDLSLKLPDGATDVEAEGFQVLAGFNGQYRWTDRDGSISYRTTVGSSNDLFDGKDTAATDGWALVRREKLQATATNLLGTDVEYRFDGPDGAAGGRDLVMVGVRDIRERTVRGQQIRLVVPVGGNVEPGASGALDALADGARGLLVGDRDEVVTVFVARSPIRRGGLAILSDDRTQDVWVHGAADADDPDSVWIHEYVHTRQSLWLDDDMEWLTEATAEYYAALLSYRHGPVSFAAFHAHLTDLEGTGTPSLVHPNSWSNGRVPYEKGAAVLAALDAKIQRESDGKRSLQNVFARLNNADQPVNYLTFVGFVDDAAGRSLEDWLDRYVRAGNVPTVPRDPTLFDRASFAGDPDSDGLSTAEERADGTSPLDPDTDGDGLKDLAERDAYGSDPQVADTDGDGLLDGVEVNDHGSSPTSVDTDGDGVADSTEVSRFNTDLVVADTDGDGLDDGTEIDGPTDPVLADTDDDGLDDGREVEVGTDPTVADTDGDGLDDGREVEVGADPTVADTDGDGLTDPAEVVEHGTAPNATDTDGDGLSDATEVDGPTDPTVADTDDDGLDDASEVDGPTDPTVADTDGDGLDDGREVEGASDPTVADTDGDGIGDAEEVDRGTDPAAEDTDDDGLADDRELELGTDPTTPTGTIDRLAAKAQTALDDLL